MRSVVCERCRDLRDPGEDAESDFVNLAELRCSGAVRGICNAPVSLVFAFVNGGPTVEFTGSCSKHPLTTRLLVEAWSEWPEWSELSVDEAGEAMRWFHSESGLCRSTYTQFSLPF